MKMVQNGSLKFTENDLKPGGMECNYLHKLDSETIIKNIQKPFLIVTHKQFVDKPFEITTSQFEFEAIQNSNFAEGQEEEIKVAETTGMLAAIASFAPSGSQPNSATRLPRTNAQSNNLMLDNNFKQNVIKRQSKMITPEDMKMMKMQLGMKQEVDRSTTAAIAAAKMAKVS